MECPKCHSIIDDNASICPKCHKVISLECPNCHSLNSSPVCSNCGYTILVKCSKCSKLNPVTKEKCSKCGFPTETSIAYNECETDEFASVIINFNSLKQIKKLLKSQDLYTKFYNKLKNLLFAQIKNIDCKFIIYKDTFVVNFNKELSFPTSSNKAVRFAIKVMNVFSEVNSNVVEELGIPLNLNMMIIKKSSEDLQKLTTYESNVKPLILKKSIKPYLKGFQLILDQFVRDEISKDFKTDSLYSIEKESGTIMFYELLLESYILPPVHNDDKSVVIPKNFDKNPIQEEKSEESDIFAFKMLDIHAKCSFIKSNASNLIESLRSCDLNKQGKIISIKSADEYSLLTSDITKFYEDNDFRVLSVVCTEEMNYKPWGVFEAIFKDYFNLSVHNGFNKLEDIEPKFLQFFKPLFDFIDKNPIKSMTSEDARFAYMEKWGKFLSTLKNTVIIINGFENLDDTTIQTLEIYFDKFKRVIPNFVFVTTSGISIHNKIKSLLRTNLYTEYSLEKTSIDKCLSTLKSDASDLIQSFYYEKINENFNGSFLYFINAIEYLKERGVLVDFDNKLIIKNKKSVILARDLKGLYKSRIKNLSKNMDVSLIFAYASIFGDRIDLAVLEALGIKDVDKNTDILVSSGFVRKCGKIIYFNNLDLYIDVIKSSLKKEAEVFLAKSILSTIGNGLDDSILAFIMGKLEIYKEEYLILWRNSQFAINTGDYDAYLKICLGFLSLVEFVEDDISQEQIEENKKEVYNNILSYLYSYSPSKIYFIENILLMDALDANDNEKVVKLSNLMLQGALVSSNYKEAYGLLHNILTRMPNPSLLVDNAVNTKFLLLLLVNIEILYNNGKYSECVEIAEELFSVLSVSILDKIKPKSFSMNSFISHLLDTFRLAAFSKLYLMDDDLEDFFDKIKKSLDVDFPDKDCILAIRDFLAGKVYSNGNVEEYSAFSKIVFLILQELSNLQDDYKTFAQNIYQAKLLALDINQKELELFCDLLIGYAYSKIGAQRKADSIYNDVLEISENSAIFNIKLVTRYLIASFSSSEKSLLIINDTLAELQKLNNQAKLFFVLFESLYIKVVEEEGLTAVDLEVEKLKIESFKDCLSLLFKG